MIGSRGGENDVGNLVPSVTKLKTNNKTKKKLKGQHHPGMTVAEIALHGSGGSPTGAEGSITKKEQTKEESKRTKDDFSRTTTEGGSPRENTSIPHFTVLTSLGDLVRNMSNTDPFFV